LTIAGSEENTTKTFQSLSSSTRGVSLGGGHNRLKTLDEPTFDEEVKESK